MIRDLIQLLLLLLIGNNNTVQPKHDLRKRKTTADKLTVRQFRIMFIVMIIIMVAFIVFCIVFMGSGTESGNYYNQLQSVV